MAPPMMRSERMNELQSVEDFDSERCFDDQLSKSSRKAPMREAFRSSNAISEGFLLSVLCANFSSNRKVSRDRTRSYAGWPGVAQLVAS